MTGRPLLSVITTTYTRARLADICDLLLSLHRQTYPRVEILFVGERHVELCDGVAWFSAQHGISQVRTFFNGGAPGLSAARNVAIPAAHGDVLAFLDDDVVTAPEWAERIIETFQDQTVIGVTGPAQPLWDDPAMVWFPEELYWIFSCTAWAGLGGAREVRNAWGMNMAFRREAFEAAGVFSNQTGYHTGVFPEDNEFSLRLRRKTGKRILYVPGVSVWHKVHRYRVSWTFMRQRAYWIGRSHRNLVRFYGSLWEGDHLLSQEHTLLRRMLTQCIPSDLAGVVRAPGTALRRLGVTFWALFFVALGYCLPLWHMPRAPDFAQLGMAGLSVPDAGCPRGLPRPDGLRDVRGNAQGSSPKP